MRFLLISLLLILGFGGGVILLQIIFSKRENKFLGLIMPAIIFGLSLVVVFSNIAFIRIRNTSTFMSTGTISLPDENGVVIEEQLLNEQPGATDSIQDLPALIFASISILFIYNIPTAVLLAVYFACRRKRQQKKALEKMQVQDLE